MTMQPKVSVVIPFFRVTDLELKRCLDSVLTQSYSNLEVLVIDDGSCDHHEELRQEYENKDSRVKFYQQKNSGVSVARNRGIALAQGEYITFLDSDDFWDNGFLYKMLQAVEKQDIVICGVTEQWYPTKDAFLNTQIFCSFPSEYSQHQYVNFSVNKLLRLSLIRKYHLAFPEGIRLGEDAHFVAAYLSHCQRIRVISDALYHYVPNRYSAVHTYDKDYWKSEKEVIEIQWAMFHQYPLNSTEKAYMEHWLYIKLSSVLFYYLSNEKNTKVLNQILQQVLTADCFRILLDAKAKIDFLFFDKTEKMQLKQLRMNGVDGAEKNYRQVTRKVKFDKLKRILLH